MTALVGCTGFVGSNICVSAGSRIENRYHSRNIEQAFGTEPDLLIYAGLRAEKYLANTMPEKDMEQIRQAEANIEKIAPKKLVLISTIDVFKTPKGVDENSEVDTEGLHPYGYNRYLLETWVREHYPDALIVRLPGLFGRNIKKNFIYDCIHVIPFLLKADKFQELAERDSDLKNYYERQENGFYRVHVPELDRELLKEKFRGLGFSALNFTDSRSRYQFYPLAHLWDDLQTALDAGLLLWHPATEPVSAGELYAYLSGEPFVNELAGTPADYDYRTCFDTLYGGKGGYIASKEQCLAEIREFVEGYENE